jgi:DNA-binding LacI/PurR family transcriptional regulator
MKGQTKYARVRHGIVNLIATEGLLPGQQLPAEKDLARRFDASIITVRQALSHLAEHRIVSRQHGRGTFVMAHLADLPASGTVAVLTVGKADRVTYLEAPAQHRLAKALTERNCQLRTFAVSAHPDRDTVRLLNSVTGVLATGWLSQTWMNFFNSLAIPVVIVGDSCTDKPAPPTVTYDWRGLTVLMGEHLFERGATKLGLITAGDGYAPSFPILNGYCDLLAARHLPYDPADALFAEDNAAGTDVAAFLETHPDLDGLLVEAGFYAVVLACLLDRRRRPRLGILSVIPPYGPWPACVSCSTFQDDIFTQGVELLFTLLQAGRAAAADRLLAPRLITPEEHACQLQPRAARG